MEDRIEVFYDGGCGLCARSRRWAEGRDLSHRLIFRDFTDPAEAASLPLDRLSLEREMVVRTGAGRVTRGFLGWLVVLDALPRWRWLARLLAAPPVRWLGPGIYRFIARHRRLFPMVVGGACPGGTCRRPSN